jgi:hypothetical protein
LNSDGTHPPDGRQRPNRPPPPLPDPAAIQACRDTLDACLTAAPEDPAGCREAERGCVGEAFRAAFEARCEEAALKCAEPNAPADRCGEIAVRCAEGVDGLPERAACE